MALLLAILMGGCVDNTSVGRINSKVAATGGGRLEAKRLPAEAVARLGSHRFVERSRIRSLTFAPDGAALLAVTDEEACLWDVATGERRRSFQGRHSVWSGALAPDGRTVVLAENGPAIDVFDAATGRTKVQMTGAKNGSFALALSPDGRRAASGDGGDILLWSVEYPKEMQRLARTGGRITALQFSPDGHRLGYAVAFADFPEKEMRIIGLEGGTAPLRLEGGPGFMACLAFSPDGKILAGSCDVPIPNGHQSSLRFWDTATGHTLHNVPGSFEAGAFSPDGRWFAASGLEHIIVYEAATGQEHHRLPVYHQHIWAVAFSSDGKTLATGQDQHIRLWDTTTSQEIAPGLGHSEPIQAIAFAPNGRTIATGGLDGRIIEWSWPGARESGRIEGVGSSWGVQHLTFSPDGQILAATAWINNDDPFFLFDAAAGRPVARFGKDHPGSGPVEFLPGGEEVITGTTWQGDGALAVWQAATGEWRRAVGHSRERILAVKPLPDTNQAWWAGEFQGLGLRDLATGQDVRLLCGGRHADAHLAVSPDGNWLAEGSSVWDLKTGEVIVHGSDSDTPCAISPDGRLLASADNGGVVLWEALTRKEIHRFDPGTGKVRALAFSPDGTVLVTSDYDDALVWDMTGRLRNGRLPALTLMRAKMESLWQDLGCDVAWVAHRAAWTLAAGGAASVTFLAGRMHPAVSDPVQIQALRQFLTDPDYDVREHAARELLDLGAELPPADREALCRPSRIVDDRGVQLGRLRPPVLLPPPALLPLPERVRSSRAVMALEHNPASEAQSLLDTLSDGAPAAPQTREAKAALARWRALAAARLSSSAR